MYPFERFTERAKKVLTLAQEEAERSHHSYIGTEHLLLGLLREGEGVAAKILNNLGVEINEVRSAIESVLGRNERLIIQQIIPTSRVKKVIEISFEEARRMGNNYVGTEHLLLGLLIEGEGIAAHVLTDLGASLEKVRAELHRLLAAGALNPEGEPVPWRPRKHEDDPWKIVRGRAESLAAEQHSWARPEHYLLAAFDADPLLRRMVAALGIDEARIADARRIATPPARLVELRAAYDARAAEIAGWPGKPLPRRAPTDAEREDLRRMREELDEAERRWRSGEESEGPDPASGANQES